MTDADGADWPPLKPMSQRTPRSEPVWVNVGDRIRVSDVGTVERVSPLTRGPGYRLTVKRSNGRTGYVYIRPNMTTTVEVVEPAFVDGGVYQDANAKVWRYVHKINFMDHDEGHWQKFGHTGHYSLDTPARPLTRLDA